MEKKIGNIFNYFVVEERTVYKLQFPNKELGTFLSQFGRGAENKTVPSFVFDLPVSYLKSFLKDTLIVMVVYQIIGIYKSHQQVES